MISYDVSINTGFGSDYTKLEWTIEPPTQEGWYWVKDSEGVYIASVFFAFDQLLMASLPDEMPPYKLSSFTHWLGPLLEPETPTE